MINSSFKTLTDVEPHLERLPEVPVQRRVDDRVEQAVRVPQPEEQPRDGLQRLAVGVEEGPDQRQHEEREPADGEGAHDDAEGGARLPLLGQLEAQLLLVGVGAGGGFDGGEEAGARLTLRLVVRLEGGLGREHRTLGLVAATRREAPAERGLVQAALQFKVPGFRFLGKRED